MSLKVLITAAASGIGLEMARAFASSGAQVYICDIDAEALQRAAAELPGLLTSVCDVGDREAVKDRVAEAARRLAGIDVLINNAGIGGPTKSVQDLDPADWDAVLRINLTGVFEVTRHAIPHLIKSGRGVIINMSSAAGRFGYPNRSPYAASKWALIGFTKTLSIELGEHGVRVNAIAPGAVAGDRVERVFQGRTQASGMPVERVKEIAMTNQSIKHLVDPKDVAALALFLASDVAKAISGQVLPIDCDMQRN